MSSFAGGSAAKDGSWKVPRTYEDLNPDALAKICPLMLMNSLTRSKDRFIPISKSKQVTWYQCGPTVYADSHIGHARTYISLDIIRRIMKEYLGYNIILCQNITDIDDKIILKSAEVNVDFREWAAKK
jgi:cysteinyl-tRNA synthetase